MEFSYVLHEKPRQLDYTLVIHLTFDPSLGVQLTNISGMPDETAAGLAETIADLEATRRLLALQGEAIVLALTCRLRRWRPNQ